MERAIQYTGTAAVSAGHGVHPGVRQHAACGLPASRHKLALFQPARRAAQRSYILWPRLLFGAPSPTVLSAHVFRVGMLFHGFSSTHALTYLLFTLLDPLDRTAPLDGPSGDRTYEMAFTPLAATDEAELDFDLLFDEDASGGECDQSWHDDTYESMNLRVMRRLLATNTDAFDRQVREGASICRILRRGRVAIDLPDVPGTDATVMVARLQVADQVRCTMAGCSTSSRDEVLGALFQTLTAAGHKVFLCRAPGNNQPGQLCFTHTYMALRKGASLSTSSPSCDPGGAHSLTTMWVVTVRRQHGRQVYSTTNRAYATRRVPRTHATPAQSISLGYLTTHVIRTNPSLALCPANERGKSHRVVAEC
jgi:hypothetical protein